MRSDKRRTAFIPIYSAQLHLGGLWNALRMMDRLELQPILARRYHHMIAMEHAAVQDLLCQRVLPQPLNRSLQRTRSISPVVSSLEDCLARTILQLESNLTIRQKLLEILQP